jgi:branched-chain amino acid transport system permease protein
MANGTGVFLICLVVAAFGIIQSRGLAVQVAIAVVVAVFALRGFHLLPDAIVDKFAMPEFDPAQYRGLLFGLAMVVMMVVRPRGFIATRAPSVFLRERKTVSGALVKEGHG